ncbi:PREDICTED: zinc finger protein 398-like [Nipponia nippon]|uniref:zinc finger protein 398-like n=1 Tax=Nipponia nippon TaxID=128390 RepID=UPI0005119531|nr:PREDICTED: zinc finger protein 398-like [Nipponia nippon]
MGDDSDPLPAPSRLIQEPVTFEDIAVYLSRAEWDAIAEGQRELYRGVMLDNYELLMSLGYPGPKPDILYRLECGEAPWICMPQSPAGWDGPDSPSPGHNGDVSWLEELPSGWWPGAGGRHVPEERPQTPCYGGRCVQWRLRSSRLLNKFKSLGGRSELPAEAAGRGVGPVESREQARTASWPGKEGAAADTQGVTANVTQSGGFPLHPAMEQQKEKADPRECLRGDPTESFQRSPQKSQRSPGEAPFPQENGELSVEALNEIVWKDHCYCVMSETQLSRCTPRPCPLRDHDYCRNRRAGVSALMDHEYCHARRIRYQGRVNKIARLTGKARAVLRRLAKRKSQIGRILRKAKQIVWRYKLHANKRLEFPRCSSSAGCLSNPPVPPAKPEDNSTKGTRGAFCPPAKREAVPVPPPNQGGSQGRTSAALHAPAASFKPSPSNAEVPKEAPRPEASVHREALRAELIQGPDAQQNIEGCEFVNLRRELINLDHASLHNAYKIVMRTVNHVLSSIRHNFELGGLPQCKEVWPVIIQTDS